MNEAWRGDGGQVLGRQTQANDARFRQASAAPVPSHSRVNNRRIRLLSIAPTDLFIYSGKWIYKIEFYYSRYIDPDKVTIIYR